MGKEKLVVVVVGRGRAARSLQPMVAPASLPAGSAKQTRSAPRTCYAGPAGRRPAPPPQGSAPLGASGRRAAVQSAAEGAGQVIDGDCAAGVAVGRVADDV